MKALTHITAGRTAIRIFLVVVVLTAGIAGTVGTVAAEPMDGKGNDPFPPALNSLDGKGNDVLVYAFPIDNVTARLDSSVGALAFPINNVTVVSFQELSITPLPSARTIFPDVTFPALVWSQDMDPY